MIAAREFLGPRCAARKVIYWVDNDPARDSLIRGFSDSAPSLSLIYSFYAQERLHASSVWFSRVPSYSNCADNPSRGLVAETANTYHAETVQGDIGVKTLRVLLDFDARNLVSTSST